MILTAHQPVYLPWLGLFHKIALADEFVSFNQVQYQPKDWNNRNRVKTAQGATWLTVPVRRKGYLDKTIFELEIDEDRPWRKKHLRTIQINYSKAKFFDRYFSYLELVYDQTWPSLVKLNEHMLRWFLEVLGLNPLLRYANDYEFKGHKSELVLDMCKQLKADGYIFGSEGESYANKASFAAAGVNLMFQNYCHPRYPQIHGEFISHLSILDLLFNCGDDSLEVLMSDNEAVFMATKR